MNAPGWTDGAHAERFMAVPGDAKVGFDAGRGWDFPDGTALVQTLSLERSRARARDSASKRACSSASTASGPAIPTAGTRSRPTRLWCRRTAGEDVETGRRQKWRFPSRAECMTCHSRAAGFVLGVTGAQLNREHDYGGVRDNQLRALDHIGLFTSALPKAAEGPRPARRSRATRRRTWSGGPGRICTSIAPSATSRPAAATRRWNWPWPRRARR